MEELFDEDESPLEESFNKAAEHLKSLVDKLDKQSLLFFYAHFKQATIGKCNTKKPGIFDVQGRKKWDAWSKLGDMSKDEAMTKYVEEMDKTDENWRDSKSSKGGLGVGVSTMYRNEGDICESDKTVFDWCKEGNVEKVEMTLTSSNVHLDELDDSGLALIHWACDRGFIEMVDLLERLGANINLQDADGQTPLHYAASCDHSMLVQKLLQFGADISLKDSDDQLPQDTTSNSQILQLLCHHGNVT